MRLELPDRHCQGIEVPHPDGKGRRYRADPRQPGSVVVDNPAHAELFRQALGGFVTDSGRASFARATAETATCERCRFTRWAWTERCPRCRPKEEN